MLKTLGLNDRPVVGVVAPSLPHQIPVELFRTSFGQVGPHPSATEG